MANLTAPDVTGTVPEAPTLPPTPTVPAEITTAAPVVPAEITTAVPAEITTAAPVEPAESTTAVPAEITTAAPTDVTTAPATMAPIQECPAECQAPICVAGNIADGGQPLLSDNTPNRCAYSCSGPDDAGTRRCGSGAAYTGANSTDCSKCSQVTPPGPCVVQGYYFYPQDHVRFPKDSEETWQSCQLRCKSDLFCKFFGYWPDKGCHVQGAGAVLRNAKGDCSADNSDTTCAGSLVISGPEECMESSYPVYPNTATAQPAPPNTVFGDCTDVGSYYTPNMGIETPLAAWQDCQTLCKSTADCETFSFWPNSAGGACNMQGANATKVNAAEKCDTTTTNGTCAGKTVVSGPGECPVPETANKCTVTGYEWTPVGAKWSATSWDMCQTLCYGDLSCQKFSYSPDGSCLFHGELATLQKSTGNLSDQVVSGAQGCGYQWYSLYPALDIAATGQNAGAVAPSPGPFLAPESKTGSEGGGFPWGWLLLALAIIGGIVAVGLYGAGMCDQGKKKKKKTKKTPSRRDLNGESSMSSRPESKPLVSEKDPLPTSMAAVPAYQPVPQVVTGSPIASAQAGQFVSSNRQVVQVGQPVAYQQHPQQMQVIQQPMQVVSAANAFDMMDRNGDGVLSAAEFNAAIGRR